MLRGGLHGYLANVWYSLDGDVVKRPLVKYANTRIPSSATLADLFQDPFHIASYTKALIAGLQGPHGAEYQRIAATCKHFTGYDVSRLQPALIGRSGGLTECRSRIGMVMSVLNSTRRFQSKILQNTMLRHSRLVRARLTYLPSCAPTVSTPLPERCHELTSQTL